jgi:hypothetical protein
MDELMGDVETTLANLEQKADEENLPSRPPDTEDDIG